MDDAIRELFDRYSAAFQQVDVDAIPDFYTVPSVTVRGDGSLHAFDSRESVRLFFDGVARGYYDEGMRHANYEILEVRGLGAEAWLVTLRWFMYEASGAEIRNWTQSYNVARQGGQWKIYASTMHRAT
jgi:uncharacterized protein (TIGR02246 family)